MSVVPILIANYHGGDVLKLCVESILRHTPEGMYRIIVGNDYDPTGTDTPYLSECRDKGWLECWNAPTRLHHGGMLNRLWNETDLGDAEFAVNLDNDTQITGDGWLDDAVRPLAPDVLAVCDSRPFNVVSEQGYCPPFYRFWFASVNLRAYRDMGGVDWRFAYADRRELPYSAMFGAEARLDYPQKHSGHFDDNRVAIDPGSALWVKVHWANPKGYRVVDCQRALRAKWRHIGHVSHYADIPDDYEPSVKAEKERRRAFVSAELARLRARG